MVNNFGELSNFFGHFHMQVWKHLCTQRSRRVGASATLSFSGHGNLGRNKFLVKAVCQKMNKPLLISWFGWARMEFWTYESKPWRVTFKLAFTSDTPFLQYVAPMTTLAHDLPKLTWTQRSGKEKRLFSLFSLNTRNYQPNVSLVTLFWTLVWPSVRPFISVDQ